MPTARYTDRPFPPYAHRPGVTPHPVSDPCGHSYEANLGPSRPGDSKETDAEPWTDPADAPGRSEALDPTEWRYCDDYLYGIDLFNHGYYWEAHEEWEDLWIDADRCGPTADFLKALIKLAAAGVKTLVDQPTGVVRHANRADQLFATLPGAKFAGLAIDEMRDLAERTAKAGRLAADEQLTPY